MRRLLAPVLLAATATAPIVAPLPAAAQGRYQSQGAAARHFQSGEASFARGEEARAEGDAEAADEAFKDAIADFRKAIDADPDLVDAYARLGRLYYDQDRPGDAIPLLEAGLARNAESDDIRFWLGQHLLRQPRRDAAAEARAIEMLEGVAARTDRFPEVHLVLANHAYDRADFSRAAEQYTRYLQSRPDAVAARARLGNAYIKQDRFADALAAFQQVRTAEPDNVAVLVNIGTAHLRLKQYPEAIEALTAALRRDPDRQSARFGLAHSYFELARYDEAIPHYQQFATKAPQSFNGQYFGGSALMAAGRDDEALPRLARAHQLRPDVAQPLYKIAIIHLRNDRAEEALAPLQAAQKLRPDDPWILSALGTAARQQGRLDEALALHQKAAAKAAAAEGDRHAKVHANLALTALLADRVDEAETAISHALARGGADEWVTQAALSVLTAAARARARAGDLPGAEARLESARSASAPATPPSAPTSRSCRPKPAAPTPRSRSPAPPPRPPPTAPPPAPRSPARALAAKPASTTRPPPPTPRSPRPARARAAAGEGAALLAAGRTAEAVTRLDAAAAARPDDRALQKNRAIAHLRRAAELLDRRLDAAADVQIAVEADALLDPIDVARAHYAALVLALRRERDREAEAHLARLTRALREAPEGARLLDEKAPARHLDLLTAYTHVLRGQDARALTLLEGLRDARRADSEAGRLLHIVHHRLGRAAALAGDLRAARTHLEAARQLAVTPALTHDVAVLDWLANRRGKQAEVWAALIGKVPEARFNTGVALEAAGKHEEAWRAFARAAREGGPQAATAAEIADAKRRVFGFEGGEQ
ncbi:MAG: tetratricopeptide repeat protein [Myxococcales bacterium]|nr:tetratricopeptide repeat protein [Myxococcales bacterium]